MSASLTPLVLAERSVPRYTSYPTAPHFKPSVDGAVAAHWLAELDPVSTLSLYLHVPYCTKMCSYCGCNTKATRRSEPLDDYTETLLAEIDLVSAATPARRVTHIHWGGGTPSLLGPERFLRLVEGLRGRFDLSGLAEHAMELDPRTVTRELALGLAAGGVNRASLGVQDLNHHVQVAIGRIQPLSVVKDCMAHLRHAGIEATNIDLMYGLPHQSEADVRLSCELAAAMRPSRFAIFGYAHVPWMKVHQRMIDQSALPGAAERMRQAEVAAETLVSLGYQAIGLDHFARPDDPMAVSARAGTLHRNFQGYTTDDASALIGLGASSIGRLPRGYVQNSTDVGGWRRAVEAGSLPTARGAALSVDDHVRASVIERLMCDFEVDFGGVAEAGFGHPEALDEAIPELQQLARDGVLRLEGRTVSLTREGRPFIRLAAAAFDAYLGRGTARHSVAV
jgi:oxygen-independent coproporphyrinogen III oxidase